MLLFTISKRYFESHDIYSCIFIYFSSPASDLAARRGVFSRRHYGSVELVSDIKFIYEYEILSNMKALQKRKRKSA